MTERQKVGGRFSARNVPFLTSINEKKQRFSSQKGGNWGGKVKIFATFMTER